MASTIVYDLVRLFFGPAETVGHGIDRVDLAYAKFLFAAWPGECLGLLPTPWGPRLYDRSRVLRGLHALEALLRDGQPDAEFAFSQLIAWLKGATGLVPGGTAAGPPLGQEIRRAVPRLARLLGATGVAAGVPAAAAAADAIYLNIGQLGWTAPLIASLLRRRPDIKAVFMLHDAIPVERPDLLTPIAARLHRRMFDVVARHAAGLIFTTEAAGRAVLRQPGFQDRAPPRSIAMPLPVPSVFLTTPPDDPLPGAEPYFVVVGAIEPRKNHRLLLRVWQELRRRRGTRTPRLVIAGAPGRGAGPILEELQVRVELRDHVTIASGLSNAALRRLVRGARAMLLPSLAEGFALPIVEALSVGTPVLAADLPGNREAGGRFAIYLDPGDPAGWLREVAGFTDGPMAALRRRIAAYRPMTEFTYFAEVRGYLEEFNDATGFQPMADESRGFGAGGSALRVAAGVSR